jgi:nitroreductase
MPDAFMQAMRFRFACRDFDPGRPLKTADLEFILEAGRLSPSSLGLEHWRFVVAHSPEAKQALQHACQDQPQVGSSAAVIVILALVADLAPDSGYVQEMLRREVPDEQAYQELLAYYQQFAAGQDLRAWSIAQCHLAAANMMTAAASLGIDSCPIGGFHEEAVLKTVGEEPARYAVALLLGLGYRRGSPPPRQRLSLPELVLKRL